MRIYPQHLSRGDITALGRAIARDKRITLTEVMRGLYERTSAAFRFRDTIYTLETTPQSLHVAQLCGKMRDVPQIHARVAALAKEMGKEYIDINGRPGWKRALKPLGYRPYNELMRYTL